MSKSHLGVRVSPPTRAAWTRCLRLARLFDPSRATSADRVLRAMLYNHCKIMERRCEGKGINLRAMVPQATKTRAPFRGVPEREMPMVDELVFD